MVYFVSVFIIIDSRDTRMEQVFNISVGEQLRLSLGDFIRGKNSCTPSLSIIPRLCLKLRSFVLRSRVRDPIRVLKI